MNECYGKAKLRLADLRSPSTLSFYERYNAMDTYNDTVNELVRQCHFLEDLRDAMIGKEGQL